MKLAKALMIASFVAASFVACNNDPVGPNVDPQLTIAAESLAVNMFTSASVSAAVSNTLEAPQYISRDQKVATVSALGAVTGIALGSTYVVAALASGAVDVLRSRPNVDGDRIAYVGFSGGGATGALFVGIERRLNAAALVVGHPGQVSHATAPAGFKNISSLPYAMRVAWIRAMGPTEPRSWRVKSPPHRRSD